MKTAIDAVGAAVLLCSSASRRSAVPRGPSRLLQPVAEEFLLPADNSRDTRLSAFHWCKPRNACGGFPLPQRCVLVHSVSSPDGRHVAHAAYSELRCFILFCFFFVVVSLFLCVSVKERRKTFALALPLRLPAEASVWFQWCRYASARQIIWHLPPPSPPLGPPPTALIPPIPLHNLLRVPVAAVVLSFLLLLHSLVCLLHYVVTVFQRLRCLLSPERQLR